MCVCVCVCCCFFSLILKIQGQLLSYQGQKVRGHILWQATGPKVLNFSLQKQNHILLRQNNNFIFQIEELLEKLGRCDESSLEGLESEKVELQQEKDDLAKRLADFEEKYNIMETNCKFKHYVIRTFRLKRHFI